MKLISVITPTWNRAIFLKKVYQSLLSQSYQKFEWIVCDDNSDDNTLEVLKNFKKEKKIKMKIYSFSERVGKTKMDNYAIKLAKGEFIYIADSDDTFSSNFFFDMITEWQKIPNNLKNKVFAIISPCYSNHYKFSKFQFNSKLISLGDIWFKMGKFQESALFLKASIIKKYKFKEIDYYVPEGTLWNKISLKYYLWIVDNFYRRFYVGSSNSISHSKKINYVYGQHYALINSLNFLITINYFNFKFFLISCINVNRYNFHIKKNFFYQFKLLGNLSTKIIYSLSYVFGFLFYLKDKLQGKVIVHKYNKKNIIPTIV
jgi:glycosyltransferase involved in cell wall biosynthesis